MKKLLSIITLCLLCFYCFSCLNACEDNGETNNTPHTHEYVEMIIEPTCTTDGYTMHVCTCKDLYKDNVTAALGHNYEWTVTQEPTETANGVETGVCTRCNDMITRDIPALSHEHNYLITIIESTCTENGYSLHKCACGEEYRTDEKPALGHNYEWTVTQEPTETTNGVETGVCVRCNDTITRFILELSHEHIYSDTVIAPTCTEQGYTLYQCRCGDEYTTDITQPLGHNYSWNVTKNATCTEKGERKATCSRCNASMTEEIEITEHNGEWVINEEPTCIAMGTKWLICTVCEEIIRIAAVEKLPHEYAATITPATCTEQGYTTYTCTRCGDSYIDDYTAISDHILSESVEENRIEPTCVEDGSYDSVVYCSVCGEELSREKNVIPATGVHNYVNYVCTNCGEILLTPDEYFTFTLLSDDSYEISAKYNYYMPANVVLPSVFNGKPVTSIGARAFSNCDDLISITIPDNVICIGDEAFACCEKLKNVSIPDSVTSIGDCAFIDCWHLTSITIPDSITSIGEGAFYCCGLMSITIPVSVTSIGKRVFYGCFNLTNITIPENVANIGYCAFSGCSSLTNITIPDSVTSLGEEAFSWCDHLTSIAYNGTLAEWQVISKGSLWHYNVPATVVHCTDGNVYI